MIDLQKEWNARKQTLAGSLCKEVEVHPDRQDISDVLKGLWNDRDDEYSRTQLLQIIRQIELVYGPWAELKRIFKAAEKYHDFEIYFALATRFDHELAVGRRSKKPSTRTLQYLVRRGWRTLRKQERRDPLGYPDLAVTALLHYRKDTPMDLTPSPGRELVGRR